MMASLIPGLKPGQTGEGEGRISPFSDLETLKAKANTMFVGLRILYPKVPELWLRLVAAMWTIGSDHETAGFTETREARLGRPIVPGGIATWTKSRVVKYVLCHGYDRKVGNNDDWVRPVVHFVPGPNCRKIKKGETVSENGPSVDAFIPDKVWNSNCVKYRGAGYIHVTGKSNYEDIGAHPRYREIMSAYDAKREESVPLVVLIWRKISSTLFGTAYAHQTLMSMTEEQLSEATLDDGFCAGLTVIYADQEVGAYLRVLASKAIPQWNDHSSWMRGVLFCGPGKAWYKGPEPLAKTKPFYDYILRVGYYLFLAGQNRQRTLTEDDRQAIYSWSIRLGRTDV